MTPVALVLVAWGCWQAAVLVDDATRRPTAASRGQHLYNGTFGQRTLCAAYLAMTAPLIALADPLWRWPITACYVWGLAITCSWLAVLALAVGLAWLAPWTLAVSGPALAVLAGSVAWTERRKRAGQPYRQLWVSRTVRGDSVDSLTCRLLTWIIMTAHLRAHVPWGRGPGETVRDLLRWDARYQTTLIHGYAHNEPLQLVYEHGVLGALAIIALVYRISPHLAVGDPWSAATLTGAVLACGTIVCRVAPLGIVWLVVAATTVARP